MCIAFYYEIIERPDTSTAKKKKKRFIFRKLHREKLYQIKEGTGVGREAAAHQSQIRWERPLPSGKELSNI